MATLLMFKGHPGTGKTTLARELHQVLGWPLVVRDEIKDQLLAEGVPLAEVGARSYAVLWARLAELLDAKTSVICDTNINQPLALTHLERLAAIEGVRIVVLECICSNRREHRRRLDRRKVLNLPGYWIDSWDKYQAYLKSDDNRGDYRTPYPTVSVDTAAPVDVAALAQSIARIT